MAVPPFFHKDIIFLLKLNVELDIFCVSILRKDNL